MIRWRERMRKGSVRTLAGAVCVIGAFALTGCSAIPAAKPIRNFSAIAGRWEGNLTVQKSLFGTSVVGATWIIKKDGTYEMRTSRWTARGTMRLDDGSLLFFDGPRASGFASLHEGPEERLLLSTGNEPGTTGVWSLGK